jgi:hypothetical protein
MIQYERFFLVAGTKYCHTLTLMELITLTRTSIRMDYLESYYIQTYPKKGPLIEEQNIGELNPFYSIARDIPPQCAREENKH